MKKFYSIAVVFIFLPVQWILAQNAPVITVGTMSSNETTAIVTITATDFTHISSCNLQLIFDSTIRATGITTGQALGGTLNSDLSVPGRISLGWFITPGISLSGNPVLFDITFEKVTTGTSGIWWSDNGYSCVFYDESFKPLNDLPTASYYINGSLTFLAAAGVQDIGGENNSCLLKSSPNPFSGSATLSYYLPEKGHVSIEILNMAGERIKTLYDGPGQEGDHSLKISSDNILSGTYMIRLMLKTNKNIITRCIKLICIE